MDNMVKYVTWQGFEPSRLTLDTYFKSEILVFISDYKVCID